ncbi:MAG: hypothetical protein U9N49_05720 [Campylobacterota bacterium]|nr:hypothetical protein [Campylobacterota bacterium]
MPKLKILIASLMILLKFALFIYPAIIITLILFDPKLKTTGQSSLVPHWFGTTTYKFNHWAKEYIESKRATTYKSTDVAATEWPMFGAVFYLQSLRSLHEKGLIDIKQNHFQQALQYAVTIVSSPDTATWVKKRWKKRYLKTGISYLESENVFYRMLLIMGLADYQAITKDKTYESLMNKQYLSLYDELLRAKYHVRDDYPDECYPVDVLWALEAIARANKLSQNPIDITPLKNAMLQTFDTTLKSKTSLPAFQVNSQTGAIIQEARGVGTSGMLFHVASLDINRAKKWYASYEEHFLKSSDWFTGFREFPKGEPSFMDADTGPIINEYGSVASLFAIGSSKSVGRIDHSALLSIEAVAYAWPTPLGFLLPSLMGKVAVDSWALGDVALIYSMTREIKSDEVTAFEGSTPWSVWVILNLFLTLGSLLIWLEIRWIRKIRLGN